MSKFHSGDTGRLAASQLSSFGQLQVNVVSAGNNYPISGAVVSIAYGETPSDTIEEVTTDLSRQTEQVELSAPLLEYNL